MLMCARSGLVGEGFASRRMHGPVVATQRGDKAYTSIRHASHIAYSPRPKMRPFFWQPLIKVSLKAVDKAEMEIAVGTVRSGPRFGNPH